MSTITRGLARRSFIAGIRLCPPASTFASSPCRASMATASSMVEGRKYSKLAGYISSSNSNGHDGTHLHRPPDPFRRQRKIKVFDPERLQRIHNGVRDGRSCADCSGLTDAFDAQRIGG